MTLDIAYNLFSKTYNNVTGNAWDKEKFISRAKNWKFLGDDNGFVAIRPQNSGMVKIVGVAGNKHSIFKGMKQLVSEYANVPVWGAASENLVNMAEKIGFRVLKVNGIKERMFLKVLLKFIPSSVFGNAEIKKINNDGSILFSYSDVGEATKFLFGNERYFNELANKITKHDKIPEFIKHNIFQFLNGKKTNESLAEGRVDEGVSTVDKLKKYWNENDIFVSFRDIDKIGINPQSKYHTPNGIYAYPIKSTISQRSADEDDWKIDVPFAGDRGYIYVLKANLNDVLILNGPSSKLQDVVHKIIDVMFLHGDFLSDEEVEDFKTVLFEEWGKKRPDNPSGFDLVYNKAKAFSWSQILGDNRNNIQSTFILCTFVQLVFRDTNLDLLYQRGLKSHKLEKHFSAYEILKNACDNALQRDLTASAVWNFTRLVADENPVKWNSLFRKIGILGVIDNGDGIIHTNEPSQAVFFNTKSFEVVDIIKNSQSSYKTYSSIPDRNINKKSIRTMAKAFKLKNNELRKLIHNKRADIIMKLHEDLTMLPFKIEEVDTFINVKNKFITFHNGPKIVDCLTVSNSPIVDLPKCIFTKMNLYNCYKLEQIMIDHSQNFAQFNIQSCNNLQYILKLTVNEKCYIGNCKNLKNIADIDTSYDLPGELTIENCASLESIKLRGQGNMTMLNKLPALKTISIYDLSTLKLKNCFALQEIWVEMLDHHSLFGGDQKKIELFMEAKLKNIMDYPMISFYRERTEPIIIKTPAGKELFIKF